MHQKDEIFMQAVRNEVRKMLDTELNLLTQDAETLAHRIHHVQQMLQLLETPELPLSDPSAPVPASAPGDVATEDELEKCACGHAREFHGGMFGSGLCKAPDGCKCQAFRKPAATAASSGRAA
jgi:hypothetical protein